MGMTTYECMGCAIVFNGPEVDSYLNPACPECHYSDDVWLADDIESDDDLEHEGTLDDAYVFASVGWGTDEDYGYYGE